MSASFSRELADKTRPDLKKINSRDTRALKMPESNI